jgi:hypothetical protein
MTTFQPFHRDCAGHGRAGCWCRHRRRLPVRQQSTKMSCPDRERRCAVLPCRDSVVARSLNHLAGLIRSHRGQRKSRWRRLDPGRQALLALAHLRNCDTLARLACGFEIRLAIRPGGRQPARCHHGRPGQRDEPDPPTRVRDPGRHRDPDRQGSPTRSLTTRAVRIMEVRDEPSLTRTLACPLCLVFDLSAWSITA